MSRGIGWFIKIAVARSAGRQGWRASGYISKLSASEGMIEE